MKRKILYCLFSFIILTSCSLNQDSKDRFEFDIPKLKEYYDPLMKDAQKWSPDAYLYFVDIPFGERIPWLLSASFYSPTKNDESLQVILDLQSKLVSRRFSLPDVLQKEPILLSQWEIDSQDALSILISYDTVSMDVITNLCGSLVLRRESTLPNRPLVWVLYYHECGWLFTEHLYLDPISGQVIEP